MTYIFMVESKILRSYNRDMPFQCSEMMFLQFDQQKLMIAYNREQSKVTLYLEASVLTLIAVKFNPLPIYSPSVIPREKLTHTSSEE